jgi:hypothetical protein
MSSPARPRRHRRIATAATLLAAMSVVAAACASIGSETNPPASTATARTGEAATPTPTTVSSDVSSPSFSVAFGSGDLSFTYPTGWHTRRGSLNPGGNEPIVYVGPTELPSDCVESSQGGLCRSWPVMSLGPNGALFAWRWFGRPGLVPPADGDPTTVGGHAALVTKGSASQDCATIGGDESISVTVLPTGGSTGWYAAEACLAGPDRTPGESAFEAMLASAQIK